MFVLDALTRLANLNDDDCEEFPIIQDLRLDLSTVLESSPIHDWASLVRGDLGFTQHRGQNPDTSN